MSRDEVIEFISELPIDEIGILLEEALQEEVERRNNYIDIKELAGYNLDYMLLYSAAKAVQ